MGKILRQSSIFSLIIICIFSIANSSSGISRFISGRQASMAIVDSEVALIGFPERIEIDYIIEKQPIEYFKIVQVERKETRIKEKGLETDENGIGISYNTDLTEEHKMDISDLGLNIEVVTLYDQVKESAGTGELFNVTNNSIDIEIMNNMYDEITLENIGFDDSKLEARHNSGRMLNNQKNMQIRISYDGDNGIERFNSDSIQNNNLQSKDYGIKDGEQINSKATFNFTWDNGSSTIYKDVIVNIIIIELPPIEINIDEKE